MPLLKIFSPIILTLLGLLFYTKSNSQTTSPQTYERRRAERQREDDRKSQMQREQKKREQERMKESNKKNYNTGDEESNTGQKKSTTSSRPINDKYYFVSEKPDINGLFIKMVLEKWGLVNKDGKEVVALKYGRILPVSGNLYAASYLTKWGFINKDGTVIIDFKYDEIYNNKGFSNGIAQVILGKQIFSIDEKGKTIAGTIETSPREKEAELMRAKEKTRTDIVLLESEKNYQLALKSQAAEAWTAALAFYKLAGFPSKTYNSLPNLNVAICILENGVEDRFEAIGLIRRYGEGGGEDPRQYFYTAKFHLQDYYLYNGKYLHLIDQALVFFKQYEAKETIVLQEKTRLYRIYGDCYLIKKEYDSALFYYKKDAHLFTHDNFTLARIIECYLAKNEISTAAEYTKAVINKFTAFEKADLYNKFALIYARKADFISALPYADTAISIGRSVDLKEYYFTHGYINYNLANYNVALTDFNNIIEIRRKSYEDLLLMNDYANAAKFRLEQSNTEIYYFRGKTYYALAKYKEACSDWKSISESTPGPNTIFISKKDIEEAYSTCSKKMKRPL